jgi:DNA polymerase-3 subunit alpha
MSFDVFEQLQKVPFDDLKHELLNDGALLQKIMASMGNTYDKLTDAVGRDNVCLELQFNKLSAQHLVNRALIEFAKKNSLVDRLIVTCDSHYSRPSNWKEREIYKKLGWLNYQNFDPNMLPKSKEDLKCELYPKNATQVWESYLATTEGMSFYDDNLVVEAIERTHGIAHAEIGDIHPDKSMKLPSYVVPEGTTEDKALVVACKEGLKWRGLDDREQYIERIKYELGIIKGKKFSRYFLTMKAIMDIAREKMLIGVGRGSAAGSLVAYVLGITNLDPIEYDLSFERFLNPHRCLAPSTLVKTPQGQQEISALSVGDFVIGGSGAPRKVSYKCTSKTKKIYRITVNDQVIECSENHLWPVRRDGKIIEVQTKDIVMTDEILHT